jgi:DNA uptake protein ComE-like DNA-binding protein
LDGVGDSMASRILNRRQTKGQFETIDEVLAEFNTLGNNQEKWEI